MIQYKFASSGAWAAHHQGVAHHPTASACTRQKTAHAASLTASAATRMPRQSMLEVVPDDSRSCITGVGLAVYLSIYYFITVLVLEVQSDGSRSCIM